MSPVPSRRPRQRVQVLLAGVLLSVAVLVAYGGVLKNGFVNWDDYEYIVRNAHVTAGLTLAGAGWAFRSLEQSNWHPLTWLSHRTAEALLQYRQVLARAPGSIEARVAVAALQ